MTKDTSSIEPDDRGERPGKTRTLWHPLFVRLLKFVLSTGYSVFDEVLVGKMPLRVDIVLIRREGTEIPESKRREAASLFPLLNRYTLIEFKGPTDSLERGDFAQLLGCAFLWHSQQTESVPHGEVSLVILAPTLTGPFRDELRLLSYQAVAVESGIFRVTGQPFAIWIVETDVMAEHVEPVLSPVSRVFLKEYRSIMKELSSAGHSKLADYIFQQVSYIHKHREDFAVQAEVSDEFAKLHDEIVAEVLESLSSEEILRLAPPSKRAELLRGLLADTSDEEKARLAELLTQDRGG